MQNKKFEIVIKKRINYLNLFFKYFQLIIYTNIVSVKWHAIFSNNNKKKKIVKFRIDFFQTIQVFLSYIYMR